MCEHFTTYKQRNGLKAYEIILGSFVFPSSLKEFRKKAQYSRCFACNEHSSLSRIHSCLFCIYLGCLKNGHLLDHFKTKKHQFAFGVDLQHLNIYCEQCKDHIYDLDADNIARRLSYDYCKNNNLMLVQDQYFDWSPIPAELPYINNSSNSFQLSDDSFFGLRGLINMGNTCFMNCILQCFRALTHTPVLRDFFLSDIHDCMSAVHLPSPILSGAHSPAALPENDCLMCEFTNIFQQFYSGLEETYVPDRLLHMIWNNSRHLAGYEQQDAHEFFISALDVLHRHCREGDFRVLYGEAWPANCSCIIDQVWTGGLQSDVTCSQCAAVSTTVDPFWDISLHIGSKSSKVEATNAAAAALLINPPEELAGKATVNNLSAIKHELNAESNMPPTSLTECLKIYTRAENLGSSAKIRCNRCNINQESSKRLSFKKLPLVFCFHLKRFEQTSKVRKKISDYISFPYELDLEPFMSESSPEGSPASGGSGPSKDQNGANQYVLYAVVNHHGTIDSGHYTAFIRLQKERWFHCDDHVIQLSSLENCLRSEAYLLFYHKKYLFFD